jgi:SET domain-containing protein
MDLLDRYLEELYDNDLMNNYAIRPSPIHGNGVFARQAFKKGDFINTHFEPGEKITDFGKHLNHSSKPCARSTRQDDDSYKTHAIKDIKKGDEITLDYTVNKNLEQPQKGWK